MSWIDRTSETYHSLEKETDSKRQERKWQEVQKFLQLAAQNSTEFGKRLQSAGLDSTAIHSFEDFSSIPPLRKKELIQKQNEHGLADFLTCDIGQLKRLYQSPGPLFDPEGADKDYWGWSEAFFAAGFRANDLVQMTFSYHLTPAGLMLEEPLREIGCCVIPAGPGNTNKQIELMTSLPVTGFVGMASYLKNIAQQASAQGLDLQKDFSLQVAFVAAEKLTQSLREEVEQLFGMRVRQGYGTADVGCIAYECPQLGGMHLSSRCYVEICDPDSGRPLPEGSTGEVVVTPFSGVYPLIRLATGDLSRLETGTCSCGRTSPKLAGILGRVDNTVKVKGQFIYADQTASVINQFPQIKNWQLIVDNQGGKDSITLRLVTQGELDQSAFVNLFQERLKLRPAIQILPPGEELEEDAEQVVDKRSFQD
jgi:phenylacetate-CoA ligase